MVIKILLLVVVESLRQWLRVLASCDELKLVVEFDKVSVPSFQVKIFCTVLQ